MNILLLVMTDIKNIDDGNIYTDLAKELISKGCKLTIISPSSKNTNGYTKYDDYEILKFKRVSWFRINQLNKIANMLILPLKQSRLIRKYIRHRKYDLILYSTPPITNIRVVKNMKKKYNCKTYLMLKDIFPQNAVDIGILKNNLHGRLLYKYFKRIEKQLYQISDFIGCMSKKNIEYILDENNYLDHKKIGLCVNGIIPSVKVELNNIVDKKKSLNIPLDSVVFFYGGNFGKPQNIDFLIEIMKKSKDLKDRFFIMCGSGTEFSRLNDFCSSTRIDNVKLFDYLPKEKYDELLELSDVGLVFLDKRFTIPNYPSRILNYMDNSKAIYAATDTTTDIRELIIEEDIGWWIESCDVMKYIEMSNVIINEKDIIRDKGKRARECLITRFQAKESARQILDWVKSDEN